MDPGFVAQVGKCQFLSEETRQNVIQYYNLDPRPATKCETQKLVQKVADGITEIEKRFNKRLEFGTAGLRGPMGCGFNCMNDVTVMQTSQGVAMYLLRKHGAEECAKRGVVVGYDGRHNSQRYAHGVAAVFLTMGFKAYLMGQYTATPTNPFCVVKYKCLAGIQVTASHNPKDDNGYKLYADNGAQIIPPMDSEIAELIESISMLWSNPASLLDPATGLIRPEGHKNLVDPHSEMYEQYLSELTKNLSSKKELMASTDLKIVYTAMHGVGYHYVKDILARCGYTKGFNSVPEQQFPDPEFTTVSFPNPEEKGALNMAMALADKMGTSIVIANDPDADRFACAEKTPVAGWKTFHGDELGILFGWLMYERAVAKGIPKDKMLFICSAVSSRMLQKMAETEGCKFEETMTGFKWMMNRALELQSEGYKPILVYEEALGYAVDMCVPDKDGISASAVWVEMCCELYKNGSTITEKLDQLRKKYGYFVTNNSYFLCYDKVAIQTLFNEFRNGGAYCKKLGEFGIKRIRDCTTGYDNGQPGNVCTFPLTPSSQMITLFFENGAVLTLRTSGTEPKLKWYAEISGSDPVAAKEVLQKVVDATIKDLMQPHKYPLEKPKAK